MKKPSRSHLSGAAVFFIGAALFFVLAASISGYFFLAGGRTVSTDNVIITVQGPTSIAGGDTVPLLITIENKNPAPLTSTSLSIEFPEGTRSPDQLSQSLARFTDTVGDIPAGGSVARTVRAVLFGKERETLRLPITFQYKTAQSNAVFQKDKAYELALTSSPISVSVSAISETSPGQPVTFSILVRSNAATPLSKVALMAEYPFGFKETTTSIPTSAPGIFSFGTLAPGDEKRFIITGTLAGQQGDTRVFRFTAGTIQNTNDHKLAVSYVTQQSEVSITAPFLATNISLNGMGDATVAIPAGAVVSAALSWANTLLTTVYGGEITVHLAGEAFDRESVQTTNGTYVSANSSVVFNSLSDRNFESLLPGDRGNSAFTFRLKKVEELALMRNPSMTITVSVSGRRVSESQVPEQVASTITRTVKIKSGLMIASDAVRTVGPFENMGPWPPVPDQETTYTIRLTASNTINTIADAVATLTLPSYVRFTDIVTPTDGSVSYDGTKRQVTWRVGALSPNVARTAAFQVALLPSTTQRGTSPFIVSEAHIVGFDRFVQQSVEGTTGGLTTQIINDPAYQAIDGSVPRN